MTPDIFPIIQDPTPATTDAQPASDLTMVKLSYSNSQIVKLKSLIDMLEIRLVPVMAPNYPPGTESTVNVIAPENPARVWKDPALFVDQQAADLVGIQDRLAQCIARLVI